MPESSQNNKSKKLLLILIPIIAVIVVLIVVFLVVIPMNNRAAYQKADELMQNEQYAEAEEEFVKLGAFEDSAAKAEECSELKLKAAAYDSAKKDYDAGKYADAKKTFDQISDFKDAKELSETCDKYLAYADAEALYSKEDYEGALAIYETLGNFEDSAEKAEKCKEEIKKKADYDNAVSEYKNENYSEAKNAFDALGDYNDSKEMSEKCSIMLDYNAAAALFAEGDYKGAVEALEALESKYDNPGAVVAESGSMSIDEMKLRCKAERSLKSAKKKFDKGDYSGAKETLDKIDENYLSDESKAVMSEMKSTISKQADYDAAMEQYNNGLFYEAYIGFTGLGDYADAAAMAESCKQPFPAAGVVYANEAYGDRSSELTIDNSGYKNAYYKLYFGDDLVMTVFIPEEGSTTFALPAGTYKMTKAYGDVWYGTTDMFGDDGRYWVCSFGGSDTAQIDPGYAYQISTGGEGTGISTSAADRSSI